MINASVKAIDGDAEDVIYQKVETNIPKCEGVAWCRTE